MIVIVDQYERGIVPTLGTYSYTLEPGLKLVVPIVQRVIKGDIRIATSDIPQQEVITKDNVDLKNPRLHLCHYPICPDGTA